MSWGPGVCDSDGPQRSFKLKAETKTETKTAVKAAPAPASAGGGGGGGRGGGGGGGGAWSVARGACGSRGGASGGLPVEHAWSSTLARMSTSWRRPGAGTAGGTSKG